jgi:hypothetical protein
METIKLNLFQKLLEIQKIIMGLGKDKATTTYRYVTGDKVLDKIKPLMNQHGILLKQEILSIVNERQDYIVGANTDKQRTKSEILSKVEMRFTWVDADSGEKDENLFGANGQNDWDKGVGSALTYAERYFLLKYFHIATDEDDIDNPDRKPVDEAPKAKPAAVAQPAPQANNQADNRPWITEKAFKQAVDRIKAGEKDLFDKTLSAFQMEDEFKIELQSAKNAA